MIFYEKAGTICILGIGYLLNGHGLGNVGEAFEGHCNIRVTKEITYEGLEVLEDGDLVVFSI